RGCRPPREGRPRSRSDGPCMPAHGSDAGGDAPEGRRGGGRRRSHPRNPGRGMRESGEETTMNPQEVASTMAEITIAVPEPQRAFIEGLIAQGAYQDPGEYLRALI